jgi:hypothetical protein
MLTATDFLNDAERQQIHNIAPGEGTDHSAYLEINIPKS